MGVGAEIISGRVTNPGAAFTAVTPNQGDSLTVRNFGLDRGAFLDDVWALGGTAGTLRIRSPRTHDNVQGYRVGYLAASTRSLTPEEVSQTIYPQDTLSVEMTGGAAETDVMSMLLWYADSPGTDARLRTWEEIAPRVRNLLTVETAHSTGATVGDYGGGVTLNSSFDLLKANADYALLGYITSVAVGTVGWRGPDTGNLRIGGPGTTERVETRDWFVKMSQRTGRPYIPIIASPNKGGTTVDIVHTAAAAAVTVQSILAELA